MDILLHFMSNICVCHELVVFLIALPINKLVSPRSTSTFPDLTTLMNNKNSCSSMRYVWEFAKKWYLEVNKCAFTFSSEIRQIQCMRTEFWCVQCPRPTGLSALDKHQIQASVLDLSYFTRKSKCKFINLIHTQQKNKIICSYLWKVINKMTLKYQH